MAGWPAPVYPAADDARADVQPAQRAAPVRAPMTTVQPILLPLPERLDGERVAVRPWREDDAEPLWEAIDGSREHLAPWMPWLEATQSQDDVLEYVTRARARWILREDLAVAIVERATGRIAGGSGLHRIDWARRAFEIGYWVRKDVEGRGYALEAARLLTRFAFEHLAATRVEIRMDTRNTRSRRVAERLGYVLEGTLRRAMQAPDGRTVDVHVFGLLPEEYRALRDAGRL